MQQQYVHIDQGLTDAQVAQAPKNIPAHHLSDVALAWHVITSQIASFFFILLIVSGALSFYLDQTVDAVIFFSIAVINACIGFFQEFHANKSAQALEKLIIHTVSVRRNGILQVIPSTEIVLGDIVIGESGDVIVADMSIRSATDLYIDESVRTGETLPRVCKEGEIIFAGAHIVQGSCIGEVIAVGKQSSLLLYAEKISKTAKNSSFEKFIKTISTYILIVTVLCLLLVLIMNVLIAQSSTVPEYILYATAMLVGVVPESLPLVVTIILTREALALAKRNVIVKKISALQNLGSMNYFFTDKTGTVTENNLCVHEIIGKEDMVACAAAIAGGVYERTPMDAVFDTAITTHIKKEYTTIFPSEELQLSPFRNDRGFAHYSLLDKTEIIRGQYMRVCAVCESTADDFQQRCLHAEQQGFRVIAFAKKKSGDSQYKIVGAVVFEDPLKSDAVTMYASLEKYMVNVKIVTGDSVSVAQYVGNKLDPHITMQRVYSMDEWDSKTEEALYQSKVYARCKPEQKSELIDAHLTHGVVGFLGEGINDALALKRADIGFVVNNATDVARQSADVILLEKSFSPIIDAIIMSRKAFAHIRTYLLCTLSGNIGTLVSLTVVVLFWKEIPMLPIQILLNNILTDIPLMFLIADTISDSAIRLPIRDQARSFFKYIFIFAFVSSLFDFIFFFMFKGYDISVLRTSWFVFSVIAELTLVFSLRSELPLLKSRDMSKTVAAVLFICYGVVLILPYSSLGKVFYLVPLSLMQIGIIVGLSGVYLSVNEVVKKFVFRKKSLE